MAREAAVVPSAPAAHTVTVLHHGGLHVISRSRLANTVRGFDNDRCTLGDGGFVQMNVIFGET